MSMIRIFLNQSTETTGSNFHIPSVSAASLKAIKNIVGKMSRNHQKVMRNRKIKTKTKTNQMFVRSLICRRLRLRLIKLYFNEDENEIFSEIDWLQVH